MSEILINTTDVQSRLIPRTHPLLNGVDVLLAQGMKRTPAGNFDGTNYCKHLERSQYLDDDIVWMVFSIVFIYSRIRSLSPWGLAVARHWKQYLIVQHEKLAGGSTSIEI